METEALFDLVDQLDNNLEGLEKALGPLLENSLHETNKKLPLLDRAKLNVTVVYAIESLLFSYIRLQGKDPKDHPVFTELRRVKNYFVKIKEAEDAVSAPATPAKPSITLNKQAAARLIQHSLVGNGQADMTQKEKELKAKILAQQKARVAAKAKAALASASVSAPVQALPSPPVGIDDSSPNLDQLIVEAQAAKNADREMQEKAEEDSDLEEGEVSDYEPPTADQPMGLPFPPMPLPFPLTGMPFPINQGLNGSAIEPAYLQTERKRKVNQSKKARKKANKKTKAA